MGARAREPVQLTLALSHPASLAREDFMVGPCNAAALDAIERWPDWPGRTLALVGPRGSGKSHLAAIWAARAGARMIAASALDEAAAPAALASGAVLVEDAAAGAVNERALFHLLNIAREEQGYVLLTAESAPATWTLRLADLASRLRAVPVVTIGPPDDALFRTVLVKLFADRQLTVDEALLVYLERRVERSIVAAQAVVAALDREGLRQQRPVTRALAAELLDATNGG
ncbi:MAG: chromosomal replication initiator DnaA [Bradyrhizobiaceae bacterium]|nr:chromosomal replication initiator DnaA [Bradyrhizobiaceae bacterium]